ncbi:MAG: hypothetical protein AAGB00_10235 [Planctomycetota bacterium]
MSCSRWGYAPLLIAAFAGSAAANFPPTTMDCSQFDYASDNFLGHDSGFASELTYTNSAFDEFSTGLNGFQASEEDLAGLTLPIGFDESFSSGAEVELEGTAFSDLFSSTPPDGAIDSWATNTAYAQGSFKEGLSQLSIRQRKVLEVGQTDPSAGFLNLGAKTKGYTVFGVDGAGAGDAVQAHLTVNFSGDVATTGNGGGSEGFSVFLVDVTDPDNVQVMTTFDGFYLDDPSSGFFYDFSMGDGDGDPSDDVDLNPNFSFTPNSEGGNAASFSYDLPVSLQEGVDYGLGVTSDAGAFVNEGIGGAQLKLDFTFDVSVVMINGGDRLLVPGLAIPEPASAALAMGLTVAAAGFPARRRR